MTEQRLREALALVDKQAEDERLWFIASTEPEAHLQQELRRLHAALEALAAPIAAPVDEWSAHKDAPESHARICKLVNECAITQSALYDTNLLPEQTGHDPIRWAYTIAVVEHINLAKERVAAPADEARALRLLKAVFDEMDDGDGNAPGHGHSRPGVWDDDNGAKAGTVCQWCQLWNDVRAMATPAGSKP